MAFSETPACVILLAMGGPRTTAEVPAYLYNIFSDRRIIRLPGGPLLQKPLAKLIAARRAEKVKRHYDLIGGGSPLLHWTEAQKAHLERSFAEGAVTRPLRCYIGMRYAPPMTGEAVRQAYEDGCRTMFFLPMYPQYCRATTGSSFAEARRALERYDDVHPVFIDDFHNNQGYLFLLREYIGNHMREDETILFSAHAIPQSFVDDGDPYVDQVRATASLAAGDREYFLSFQSRTGPVAWVGPDTVAEARRLLGAGRRLFVVPISFVCDHIETLYEIDIELKQLLNAGERIRRMPMFNDDPRLARTLARIIDARRNVEQHL
ncbi:MAG TPA: ferrochelatase [candidate division Zixibacteria bacterium]|nr:ferrochelatase [candidate division Zixibacteria bacterium]MDD4917537.1 ferrochelatase [candidate division Zixibacteria bacterium]MDM7972194.1 ferrochelatase [candidate division Zixibacteria bacterium]HOD67410.1 ferrochelatase [candidate division Zixibacteria bacterium]HOZ06794.1 ferrochelatase [candidate division Zixibacteria bacterium]